jgi:hypothetical protein
VIDGQPMKKIGIVTLAAFLSAVVGYITFNKFIDSFENFDLDLEEDDEKESF